MCPPWQDTRSWGELCSCTGAWCDPWRPLWHFLQFSLTLSCSQQQPEAVAAAFSRANACISSPGVPPCNARLLVMPGSVKENTTNLASGYCALRVPQEAWGSCLPWLQLRSVLQHHQTFSKALLCARHYCTAVNKTDMVLCLKALVGRGRHYPCKEPCAATSTAETGSGVTAGANLIWGFGEASLRV